MKWLLAAVRKNARRIQLEQLILLAVRTLLVLCVVLAMANRASLVPGRVRAGLFIRGSMIF